MTYKNTAQDSYENKQKLIANQVKLLTQVLVDHRPEQIDWSHVGDLSYVHQQLEDILDFIRSDVEGVF